MKMIIKIASFNVLLLMLVFPVFAEGTWTTFTNGNDVQDIAVDDRYVWCGTLGGVVRWDKTDMSCKKFTTSDGLSGNGINSLRIAPNGDVWVATYDGVSKYNDNNWTSYYQSDGLPLDGALAVGVTPDGTVWVSTSTRQAFSGWGISRYDGDIWDTFTRDDGLVSNTIYSIAVTPDGVVWAANIGGPSYNGVSLFDNGKWTALPDDENLALNGIRSIAASPDGAVWIGSYEGLSCYDGSVWMVVPMSGSLKNAHVRSAAVAPNGDVWAAVWFTRYAGDPEINIGLAKYDGDGWTTYSVDDGLPDNHVNAVTVDNDGAVWAGTLNGLCRYDGDSWTTFKTENEMAQSSVRSLDIGNDGTVWVGTWGNGISRFDGKNWDTFTTENGLSGNYAISLFVLPGGEVWAQMNASGYNAGLCFFDGSSWISYTEDDIVDMSKIHLLGVSPAGDIWCSDTGSIYRHDGRQWQEVLSFDAEQWIQSQIFAFAPDNVIWYESQYGEITCYDGVSFSVYTENDGLPSSQLYSLAIDSDGMPWISSFYKKLLRFDGNTWVTEDQEYDLHELMFDRNGKLWCSVYDDGLVSYDGINRVHLTPKDGLAGISVRAIAEGHDGSLWFGTSNGLSRYIPDDTTLVESKKSNPSGIRIFGNYPNPFNPFTTIEFSLPHSGFTELVIYNIAGQKIRELVSDTMSAGFHSVVWDGTDENDNAVSSGIFICRLETNKESQTVKMLLMK